MKSFTLVPMTAATILASVSLVPAQSPGTGPQEKGNSGWTGGSRDQPSQNGQNGQSRQGDATKPHEASGQGPDSAPQGAARDPDSAQNQPWMAEGLDLKGPPRQLPASKTPE